MSKSPTSELILDRLAAGIPVTELKEHYGVTKQDLITAALYGMSELREEYIQILLRRRMK